MSSPATQPEQNPLGVQSIPQLLLRYAVPSVVSMLVMALYNIVDQIFIGWGVGYLGNAATTVTFPLMTVSLALSLLIGNGTAAFISLEMGRGNTDTIKKILGNAVLLAELLGIALAIGVLLFLKPLLRATGATESMMPYAVEYAGIIALGFPFSMASSGISSIIRADGSPRFSMVATLTGCVLNVFLDPLFIFVFGMGVRGAAIATVISQMVSCFLVYLYFFKYARYARLEIANLRFSPAFTKKVAALGSSSFINQMSITVVNIMINNTLKKYGALSPYGSDIPISAMGIVMKINAILISCILGVTIGAQPILGYNYGAGKYRRVRRVYLTEIAVTISIAAIFSVLFLTAPGLFVRALGDKDPQFNEFAARCLRTFLCTVTIAGFQIPSANYFQAVGKPTKAMTLTMSRQILFFIPALLILSYFWGLDGILYSAPVADVLACLVTSFFIFRELRHLRSSPDTENPEPTEAAVSN